LLFWTEIDSGIMKTRRGWVHLAAAERVSFFVIFVAAFVNSGRHVQDH